MFTDEFSMSANMTVFVHANVVLAGKISRHLRTSLTLIFIRKGFYSSNNVVRCMAKLFSVSDEFRRLCTNVNMYPHSIDVTPIHVLRCSV